MSKTEYISSVEQLEEGVFYCLPSDVAQLDSELESIAAQRTMLADELTDAMGQSSETWHDNAPADVLYSLQRQLNQREATMRKAARTLRLLPYPEADLDFITVGSRVDCDMAGDRLRLDIVGNLPIHRPYRENDIEVASIAAPISRALLGKRIGETAIAEIGPTRSTSILIFGIEQLQPHSIETTNDI
jgi:transcription elongation GreA/GreB family factor